MRKGQFFSNDNDVRIQLSSGMVVAGAFLFSFLLTLFVSCTSEDTEEGITAEIRVPKTVFVYMPWTGGQQEGTPSLLSFFQRNINDMATAMKSQGKGSVRTVVFLADGPYSAELFELLPDGRKLIGHYNCGGMYTSDSLTALINTICREAPATRYAMVIGSHADGWLPAGDVPRKRRSFGGMSPSLRTDIGILSDAITASEAGKMQFVCFDDCYMANIETAYRLRKATEWLLASCGEMMEEGLPYGSIWRYLAAPTPRYDKVVAAFAEYYQASDAPYGSLSAIDCSKMDALAGIMRTVNAVHSVPGDTCRMQYLDGYTPHIFYDMGDYARALCGSDSISLRLVNDAIRNAVPYYFCTPELYTVYQSPHTFTVGAFSGITISDPSRNAVAEKAKRITQWWLDTH